MRNLFYNLNFLFVLALVILLPSCAKKKNAEELQGSAIIAYIEGGKSLDASKINASKVTHINYAFAQIKDGKAYFADESVDVENIKKLNELKASNPNLRVLVSVAAKDWSKSFDETPLTDEASKSFAKSVADIVKANNLDGIDINWGYPLASDLKEVANISGLSQSFIKAIASVKEELNALEKETDKAYTLSCAVETDTNYIANTGMKDAQQYLNFINVIVYNFLDAKIAIHQANLYPSDKYQIRKAASVAIQDYINSGVSPEKLVLGIPFYGNVYKVKKDSQTGIGDPVVEKTGTRGYTFIKDSLINQKEYFRYWDNEAQAPYVYNYYNSTLVTYNDEESVKAKCQYVKDNDLAGVMFWEYNSDPKGFLLDAINQILK